MMTWHAPLPVQSPLQWSNSYPVFASAVTVTVEEEIHSDGRESYIRAVVSKRDDRYTAVTTGGQGSHMMTSLVQANALLIVPEGVTYVAAQTELSALMIDWPETVF